MCGRYTQTRSWSELVEIYRLTADATPLNIPARYNIAPTQDVPIVRRVRDGDDRALHMVRWGLVPFWAKDLKIGTSLINARAETVDAKPSVREAFKRRRCLIPASAFYEWRKLNSRTKQPYHITLPDNRPFAFAGLWEFWKSPEGEKIESCTIVVTAANKQLKPIHDRMPVILEPRHFDDWLDTTARSLDDTKALFRPYDRQLAIRPVTTHVNNVRNDDPQCMAPVAESAPQSQTLFT